MNDTVTIVLSQRMRDAVVAKALLVIVVGLVFGYVIGRNQAAEYERGEKMTREAHAAGFDQYKAELSSETMTMPQSILVGLLVLAFGVAVYEAAAVLLTRVVSRVADTHARGLSDEPPYKKVGS